jgi:hypothetical protein
VSITEQVLSFARVELNDDEHGHNQFKCHSAELYVCGEVLLDEVTVGASLYFNTLLRSRFINTEKLSAHEEQNTR